MLLGGHLLSILIFFPAAGALALLLLRGDDHKWIRGFAFGISVVEFALSLGLLWSAPVGTTGYQREEFARWIGNPPINFLAGAIERVGNAALFRRGDIRVALPPATCRAWA